MDDLFGDIEDAPKPKRAKTYKWPEIDPATLPKTKAVACTRYFDPPLDHQCYIGGGGAGNTMDGGRTWMCDAHTPPEFWSGGIVVEGRR